MPDKRTKLLIVINDLLVGGAQRVMLDLLAGLDRSRFEPILLTLFAFDHDELYDEVPQDVPVYRLRFSGFSDTHSWFALAKLLRTIRPHVVLANLFFSNTVMRVLAPFFGYRIFIVEHNTYTEKTRGQRLADRFLARITERIIAVSKTVADFTAQQEGISPEKFIVIYNGIDLEALRQAAGNDPAAVRREFSIAEDEQAIVSVARMLPQKNHRLLLEGFARFSPLHPNYRLLLVGGGKDFDTIKRYAQELGLGDRVLFLGYRRDVPRLLSIADFFVSTSKIEGFGIAHAEALALGVPVLTTKTAGPDEMIQEGINGFFIPKDMPEAVAAGLEKMIAAEHSKLSQAARDSAKRYSIEKIVDNYERLFTKNMRVSPPFFYSVLRCIGRQTWIRWGVRYRVFQWLKPIDCGFSVPFYGRIYRGNLNNFIDRAVYFYGAHERETMEYMGSLITPDSVVLDIGANVGHHSLYFSTKAKEVHAFEPNPAFRHHFDTLLRQNGVENVFLHEIGLGAAAGEIPYYAPTGDNQGVGSFVREHRTTNRSIGALPIRTGDEVVASLGLTRVDFIKIDVERYEEAVLMGLQKTLKKFRPIIVMEYAQKDFSSEESFQALTEGYIPKILESNNSVFFFFNDPKCRPLFFDALAGHGELVLVPSKS